MAETSLLATIFPPWVQILLFPVLAMLIWTLLFNSKSSRFSKLLIEGGYLVFAIPLIVITFLSIPMMGIMFWAKEKPYAQQISLTFMALWIGATLIIEYYFIKSRIKRIEELEQMPIWDVIKRDFSKEYRETKKKNMELNKVEAVTFFDEITDLNRQKRELDREEKEKLRRALLGHAGTSQ